MYSGLVFAVTLVVAVLAVNIPISVGGDKINAFVPSVVNAKVGDNLIFTFHQTNHSVMQSTFAKPCTPLPGGFSSPFFVVSANDKGSTNVTVRVNDTSPIWFFCPQTIPEVHCTQGMVGAVNPPANNSFQQFQRTALLLGQQSGVTSTANSVTPTASVIPNKNDDNSNAAVSLNAGKLLVAVSVIAALTF